MRYLHNFVNQAKELQKMEQEIFLEVKGSLKLLEFYSAGYSTTPEAEVSTAVPCTTEPSPTLPLPFTTTSLCLASVGARRSISTC